MGTRSDADYYCDRAESLSTEDRIPEALQLVEKALGLVPGHTDALVLAGDIYSLEYKALKRRPPTTFRIALDYYERALAVEPRLAEAWAGKAYSLRMLGRRPEALAAADTGLGVLPLRIGRLLKVAAVYTNIAESLHKEKTMALLELGRGVEAREALSAGLAQCPESSYLTRLASIFLPKRSRRRSRDGSGS